MFGESVGTVGAAAASASPTSVVSPAICEVTIYENAGPRRLPPEPASTLQNVPVPQPGDCTAPNNWFPLSRANGFSCAVDVTLGGMPSGGMPFGGMPSGGTPLEKSVKPDKVALSALATADGSLVFDLTVEFTNSLGCTAAAVLSVPRLPDLLLLEEKHRAGDVTHEPKVLEKERAQVLFDQAAASTTHSATLSDTMDDVFSVQLDKVAAGATATFGCKFLARAGLRTEAAVVSSGDDDAARIADLAILPGFSPLAAAGVPFDFTLLADARYAVALPSDAVLREDAARVNHECATANADRSQLACGPRDGGGLVHVCAIAQLAPSLASNLAAGSGMRAVRWSSQCGLAAGTLLKIRLVERAPLSHVDVSTLELEPPTPITDVDTCARVTFSAADGAPRDVSRVRLTVPATLPGAAPAASPHALYVIVDTSGSTGMCVGGNGDCFLDKSKVLLDAILRALPDHVAALRGANAINSAPVTVRLWRFDRDTSKEHEVALTVCNDGGAVLAPLRASIGALRPGGCTNYDSWASELRAAVTASPSSLHSVLLVTDGGATQRERFFDAIEAIASQPGVGFFQCDALGYGPWLDPRTVTFLASATGGEAIMVESLDGDAVHKKVLGLLARSMLRAASRMTLRIAGGRLLAVRVDGTAADEAAPPPPKASVDALTIAAITSAASGAVDSGAFMLEVLPTAKLCLAIDHPSDRPPALTIGGNPLPWPAAIFAAETPADAVDAESAPLPASARAVLQKLRSPATAQALRHLPLLEPSYALKKPTSYPKETVSARAAACLAISLKGRIVAPSVTKGVAVATLATTLQPVPEHCRPKPAALSKAYQALPSFEDDSAGQSACPDLITAYGASASKVGGLGQHVFGNSAPAATSLGFSAAAGFGCSAPAATSLGFGAPAAFGCSALAATSLGFSAPAALGQSVPAATSFGFGAPANTRGGFGNTFPTVGGFGAATSTVAGPGGPASIAGSFGASIDAGGIGASASAGAFSSSTAARTMLGRRPPSSSGSTGAASTPFWAPQVQALLALPLASKKKTPQPDSGPPPLPKWVGLTRGGLYAGDIAAIPSVSMATSAKRIGSRDALADALAALAPQLELAAASSTAPAGGEPLNTIDSVSSSHAFGVQPARCGAADPLDSKLLRLVECTRRMYPAAAGTDTSWAAWARKHKRSGAAAWTELRSAWREALRQSVEGGAFFTKASAVLQRLEPLASDPRAWPWLVPAPAPAAVRRQSPASVHVADASLPTGDLSIVKPLSDEEHTARVLQVDLYDSATRRDCYNVLVAPAAPADPAVKPSAAAVAAAAAGCIPFEAVLWLRGETAAAGATSGAKAAYAFGPRDAPPSAGFSVASDQTTLDALGHLGALEPHAMAVTVAFESFLSKLAAAVWTPGHTARLSVNFLVTFGPELTPRLDALHRIRSTKLNAGELATLRSDPFKNFVDSQTLLTFQE